MPEAQRARDRDGEEGQDLPGLFCNERVFGNLNQQNEDPTTITMTLALSFIDFDLGGDNQSLLIVLSSPLEPAFPVKQIWLVFFRGLAGF